jgi:hypothetical protein
MFEDPREGRAEAAPVCFSWGMPIAETADHAAREALVAWLAGGGLVLGWTMFALLLTSG